MCVLGIRPFRRSFVWTKGQWRSDDEMGAIESGSRAVAISYQVWVRLMCSSVLCVHH